MVAGAMAVALLLASPAAAQDDGGGDHDEHPWDTDNLRYGGYTARSFNVPFHEYGGYSETACQSGVADAFFQAGGTVGAVNDFPYLDWDNDSDSWVEKEGGTRNRGCDEFVKQQDKMVSQIRSNGGYYLDLSGNLRRLTSNPPSRFSGRSLRLKYGSWTSKGDGFARTGAIGEVGDRSPYKIRVDGWATAPVGYYRAIFPSGTTWNVPKGTQNGRFGGNWHGTTRRSGSSLLTRVAKPDGGVSSREYLRMDSRLCPVGFHPRGEDSVDRIGSHTGRTLTGLSHLVGRTADRYWCRSDLRFDRRFQPENHTGVTKHPQAATREFTAYGRLNCYYTAFTAGSYGGAEGIRRDSSGGMVCSYLFPIPQCDSNNDGTADSDYTADELGKMRVGSAFNRNEGESCTTTTTTTTTSTTTTTTTTAVPGSPTPTTLPPLPDFGDDACVTVTLKIDENRTKNSKAEPGIQDSHQTLRGLRAPPAWDLDVTSPHPNTASPPRTDNSGCAYGPESRADHGRTADSAARKNAGAPDGALPTSSSAGVSTHPPHNQGFATAGTDYTGAVQNMAHRYASRVAENTCAAKRAEARLRLEMLEAEANIYKDWMSRYSVWAGGVKTAFSDWLNRNPALSTSSAANPTFNSYKHAVRRGLRRTYAARMETLYGGRESQSALVAGRSLSKPVVGSSWCGDVVSLVSSYARSVTALRTSATGVLSFGSAPVDPGSGPSAPAVNPLAAPRAGSVTSSTEGTEPKPPVYRTDNHSSSYCHTSGAVPRSGRIFGVWVTVTIDGDCTREVNGETVSGTTVTSSYSVSTLVTAAVAEVKATAIATYNSYTLTLSSGTWSQSLTVPSATGAAVCSSWRTSSCYVSETHPLHSSYVARLTGSSVDPVRFPTITTSPSNGTFANTSVNDLLGRYYASHPSRTGLKNTSASVRDATAAALGELTATATGGEGTLPAAFAVSVIPRTSQNAAAATADTERSQIDTAATTWRNAYTTAYDNAYAQAATDMGNTATTTIWNRFAWRYKTDTLAWGDYQEDTAATFSASAPMDGTGCDLIAVGLDGSVSVDATRLDYEGVPLGDPLAGSRYGVGSVFGERTAAQRTCKILRKRTPELILEYQPVPPPRWGLDASKGSAFWHVDYQPTPGAERFKLYGEAEVFAVKVSLADSVPVLCYAPEEALVAHVGAQGIDAVNKAVFREPDPSVGENEKHCFRHPSVSQPAFAFFDDTAHSAMDSVSVVWQQPTPKIVSKLGSTDDLKMMANTVNLVASSPVAYVDATRTSSFYGTYYTFPTGSTVESPSGWDITGHPTLTLASTFAQHVVQAKDTSGGTPTTESLVFKFVDCVFGIEDVAFVDNIASPYALLSKNGVVPSGWKQTYDSDPHNSPTWYYPAFSTYEGALRLDGRRDRNGDPITYRRNPQGGFAHPSHELENTPADGIGWGIVYEDRVNKQQPVWAIYAPPVPGDNTRLAIQVCGTNNLGAGGANPVAATGTPAARRIDTPASPPPASGAWAWKTAGWNYQDMVLANKPAKTDQTAAFPAPASDFL